MTSDSSGLQSLLENLFPRSLIPLRYFITCFAASMCPGEELELYLEIILVIIAIWFGLGGEPIETSNIVMEDSSKFFLF